MRHTWKPDNESLSLYQDFLAILGCFIIEEFQVVFVDEFTTNRKTFKQYGWAPKGKDSYLFIGPINRKVNGIIAVSQFEMIALDLFEQNTNSDVYSNFILNIHLAFKERFASEEPKVVYVFDNARYHVSSETM